MNKEQMRIAIAEAYGFKRIGLIEGHPHLMGDLPPTRGWLQIPDYLNDLNAMNDVELNLPDNNSMHGLVVYHNKLLAVCGSHKACVSATAEQRAEAFLKTIDKWVDDVKLPESGSP